MFKSLLFFVRFFAFWILFFFLDRLTFLIINYKKIAVIPLKEIMATFFHAIPLDISMIGYLMVIPLFGYIFYLFSGKQEVNIKWLFWYNSVLTSLFCVISVINFNIYREWGSKINARAVGFAIYTPNEALASGASSPVFLTLFVLAILIAGGLLLQHHIIPRKLNFSASLVWQKGLLALLLFGLSFVMIRGGVGGSPINQSMAYFSKNQLLNNASVNTEWNLMRSVISSRMTKANPYLYIGKDEANEYVSKLFQVEKDTTISILKAPRPNVVLVIIESFTADLTMTLGGTPDITPNFDSLINKGVLFSNVYATGNRTDKGLIGTLAGFPTLAAGSIVKWPEKMQKIPAISQSFFNNGYQTSFYYGGESEFDNYKAFILSHNYQRLVDRNSFEEDKGTSWGQYDEATFTRQIADLNKETQPFFSTLLTLTNHEPYGLPGKYKFGKTDNIAKFKSTAYYTDSCINAYINNAKKTDWYKNTLFVFIADHGHLLPKNSHDIFEPERYHIPLLLYGEVIKDEYKGAKMRQTGSQNDVVATVLAQLNISSKEFAWSKNLLNPYTKPFAFFSWDNGMGFIHNKQCVTFDNVGKTVLYNSNIKDTAQTDEILINAKSYLQNVYQQFIEF